MNNYKRCVRTIVAVGWLIVSAMFSLTSTAEDSVEKSLFGKIGGKKVVETSGVKGGVVVHLGCGDGKVTATLDVNARFKVHGLDRDAGNVWKASDHIRTRGLGGQVQVTTISGSALPYPDNFVNLVVIDELGDVLPKELARVLVPGGVIIVSSQGVAIPENFQKKSLKLDGFLAYIKPMSDDLGDWAQWRHGADGNMVTHDKKVGLPRSMQWITGSKWSRHHETIPSTNAMVSSGGRLFYINDKAPVSTGPEISDEWTLTARDAFNGVLLWERPIPLWGYKGWSPDTWYARWNKPYNLPGRLLADKNEVYMTLGYDAPVSALDAATGEVLRVYKGTEGVFEIILADGLLCLAIKHPEKDLFSLQAFEAKSGARQWKSEEFSWNHQLKPLINLTIADQGKGVVAMCGKDEIVNVDIATGKVSWKKTIKGCQWIRTSSMLSHGDAIFIGDQHQEKKEWYGTGSMRLLALSAKDGTEMWNYDCGSWGHKTPVEMFVIDDLIWVHSNPEVGIVGLDMKTGKVAKEFSTVKKLAPLKKNRYHHHRCYRNRSTSNYILTARRGIEFTDIKTGTTKVSHWTRGACLFGTLPANGMIYTTPDPCDCYASILMHGYGAYSSTAPLKPTPKTLIKGSAYGQERKNSSPASTEDWPTYRCDGERSGSSSSTLSSQLVKHWSVQVKGVPTAITSAAGMIFFGGDYRHFLHALDAKTGNPQWRTDLGGRIDTPPTYYNGLLLCGLRNGQIVCLLASTGERLWTFSAAPMKRIMIDHNKLESAWPAHGAVLVQNGRAYVTAGRSSMLDGGIHIYALDPETGRVLAHEILNTADKESGEMLFGKSVSGRSPSDNLGALSDILVGDGKRVFMRHSVFDEQCREERSKKLKMLTYPHLRSNAGLLDEDHFHRTSWNIDKKIYYKKAKAVYKQGQMLVFNDDRVYGIRALPARIWHSDKAFFHPGTEGFTFFADARQGTNNCWKIKLPLRANAMAATKDLFLIAGTPDAVLKKDGTAVAVKKVTGKLMLIQAKDGTVIQRHTLASKPVFDGMAIARGHLYISLQDGTINCFGTK